jgi:two-component system alkaline phosphatase synthesis response regulator PhoP
MTLENLIEDIKKVQKDSFTKDELITFLQIRYFNDPLQPLESNGVTTYPEKREIEIDGKKFNLPKKQFLLVHHFIKNKNKILNRDNILKTIWPEDVVVCDRTVDVHIRLIRRNLSIDCIGTKKGVGYIWLEK